MRPTTSIIVPSYRGETKLPTLLAALARQDTDDFEIVVVVDGRLDGSTALLESAARELPIRAVVLERNQGRVRALNAGFETARGEILVRCDDDLEPAVDFVSGHACRHSAAREPVGVIGIYLDRFADSAYTRAYGSPRERRFRRDSYRTATPWRYWAGNCSVTRETWERVGTYDTAYQHYGWEDVDYGYRLHEAGIPVLLAPELETLHHGAATSAQQRTLRAYHSGAARKTFEALHPGALPAPLAGGGAWGTLVSGARRLSSEHRFELLATAVDRGLPYVPRLVGEKLTALAVESASLAGYDHADRVRARF